MYRHGLRDRDHDDQHRNRDNTAGASTAGGAAALRGRGRGRGFTQDADLTAHLQQLQADTNAILAGSTVTDAQRLALRTDLRSIAQAGLRVDKSALSSVVDSLRTTLADGTYDSDASVAQANRDAFNALFSGSSVDQTRIDQTCTDLVAIARNRNNSTDELSTLSADRAAIQADLTRLGIDSTHAPSQSNADLVLGGLGGGFGHRRGRGQL